MKGSLVDGGGGMKREPARNSPFATLLVRFDGKGKGKRIEVICLLSQKEEGTTREARDILYVWHGSFLAPSLAAAGIAPVSPNSPSISFQAQSRNAKRGQSAIYKVESP